MSEHVTLRRNASTVAWGFRLQGGRDFAQPLVIINVIPGSVSDAQGLRSGNKVLSIGGQSTLNMTHEQAQEAIKQSGNELQMETVEYTEQFVMPSYYNRITNLSTLNTNSSLQTVKPVRTSVTHYQPPQPTPTPNETMVIPPHDNKTNVPPTGVTYGPTPYRPSVSSDYTLNSKPTIHTDQRNDSPVQAYQYKPTPIAPNTTALHQKLQTTMLPAKVNKNRPICHSCNQEIHGPYVDTTNHCYCPEHFTCAKCNKQITDGHYGEANGQIYCEPDFIQSVAPKCASCNQSVIGEITKALDKTWHPRCFVCAQCKKPLRNEFRMEDDQTVLCEEDWSALHTSECAKCKKSISEIDRFIDSFGKKYHAGCFCCAACQAPLEGKPFHARDNMPFCPAHANAVALYG